MPITINASTSSGLVQSADNSGQIELQTNGTTVATVNTSNNVQFRSAISVGNATPSTSGAGITFPATQSASTDANTLDDYEEGTWTPTLTFSSGSVTYSNRAGQYTKIGNLVTLSFWIRINTISSPSGTLTITGLPFASNSTASRPSLLFRTTALSGVTGVIGAWLDSTSTVLNVVNINNGVSTDLNANTVVSNSEFDAFFVYQV